MARETDTIIRPRPAEALSTDERAALEEIEQGLVADADAYVKEVIAQGAAYGERVREHIGTRALVQYFGRELAYSPTKTEARTHFGHARSRHIGAGVRRAAARAQLAVTRGGQPPVDAMIAVAKYDAEQDATNLQTLPKLDIPAPSDAVYEQPALMRVMKPGVRLVRQPESAQPDIANPSAFVEGQDTLTGVDSLIAESSRTIVTKLQTTRRAKTPPANTALPDTNQFPALAHWLATGRGGNAEASWEDQAASAPIEETDSERTGRGIGRLLHWGNTEERRRRREDRREAALEELYANW